MTQEICPFCKNAVNDGAEVCHSCGAQKGYGNAGQSKNMSGFMGLGLAIFAATALTTGEGLVVLLGALTGLGSFILILVWLATSSKPPQWYRDPRQNNFKH